MIHQYFISITCAYLCVLLEIHTSVKKISVIRRCYKRETCVICLQSANCQWKIVDERNSGNIFANDHWYSMHISRIVCIRASQTTQKLRKTAQYCVNSYVKPSFELLKTRNYVKRRSGEHRRPTTEVPHQTNWWNAQIAHVSRKTRILCVIHVFTRLLGCVTTT